MTSSFIYQTARGPARQDNPSGQPIGCVERYSAVDAPNPDDGDIDYRFAYIVGPGTISAVDTDAEYTCSQVTDEPDAGDLVFAWTAPTVPGGATATFSAAAARTTNFQGDTAGTYVLRCALSSTGNANPANRNVEITVIVE